MEGTTIYDHAPGPEIKEMKLSEESKYLLGSSSKWAKFIAVFTFIMIGIAVVSMLFMMLALGVAGTPMSDIYGGMHGPQMGGMQSMMFWPVMIFCVIYYIVLLLPTIYLYRFAQKAQKALSLGDEATMTESFRNLRGSFKVTGIILIAGVGFSILLVIVLVAAGVAAAL